MAVVGVDAWRAALPVLAEDGGEVVVAFDHDAVAAGSEVRTRAWEPPPPSQVAAATAGRGRRLRDGEVADHVRRHGPVLRADLNCYPYAVTRLIVEKKLRVTYTKKGQMLAAD